MTGQNYTFGESETAAERLELLARVYEKTTRVLLVRALSFLNKRPRFVLDVGSGPGATTRLLAEVIRPLHVVGLDKSESFVQRAQAANSRHEQVSPIFLVHDALRSPYPLQPADFLYCRHLLTHLSDPNRAVRAFLNAVSRDGLVVLEENTFLHSSDEMFQRYYAHVLAMQRHYGQDMQVGSRLLEVAQRQEVTIYLEENITTLVDPISMARLHEMNLRTWREDPFAVENFDSAELDQLGNYLQQVAVGVRAAPPVQVGVTQLVLSKRQ